MRRFLEGSWSRLESILGVLARCLGDLGPSRSTLGASLGPIRQRWGLLGLLWPWVREGWGGGRALGAGDKSMEVPSPDI
eukprot:5816780-Pyramimonas_sp.AAC.1